MEKQIEQFANDIQEATHRASQILVEETRAFVKANRRYHSKDDFDKVHPKTLAELEAEYLTEQGYRKQVEAEWMKHYFSSGIVGYVCSNNCGECLTEVEKEELLPNYCSNCGAKMKGN